MRLLQDFSYALRSARLRPMFTVVLIAALALGIGLTTAIFSVFYGVLLKPLGFREPSRLVLVRERLPQLSPVPVSLPPPEAIELARTPAFADAAIFISAQRNTGGEDRPERVDCLRASSRLLPTLGLTPMEGRNFTSREDETGVRVALISRAFELRRFGSRQAVGETILLDSEPYRIVGVLPAGLVFPTHGMQQTGGSAEVWVPLSLTPEERAPFNSNYRFALVGRIRDGATLDQARGSAAAVMNRIVSRFPPALRTLADVHVALLPLREEIVGDSRRLLFLLLGTVGALLLITCMNVSNMLLSRALARRREMAVRAALGASARRIVWQMLDENLLLFTTGGLLGALCAAWFQSVLLGLLPPDLPRTQDVHIDAVVLAFTVAVSLLTGLVFGLAPALGALRVDLTAALQDGSRGQSGGLVIGRTRRFLVAAQIALAFILLTSAGLLIRSFLGVLNRQAELRTEHVLTFGLDLPDKQYPTLESAHAFFHELSDRLERNASVTALGFGTDLPLENADGRFITPERATAQGQPLPNNTDIDGAYFQSLGQPLLAGRYLNAGDRKTSERVAIVNQAFGRAYWAGGNALDHRFKIGPPMSAFPWIRIVGVVADSSAREPDQPVPPHMYTPWDQELYPVRLKNVWFVVRTRGDGLRLGGEVRDAVRSLNPALPIVKLRSMEQVVSGAVAPRSANTWLVTVFAMAALLLTALGVYGVIAHSVSERTREIGIRMALGAAPGRVARSVFQEGLRLMAAGLVAGIAGSFAVARLIAALLYGVSGDDALTMAAAAAVLALTALGAMMLPSWRAMRVDPWAALREE